MKKLLIILLLIPLVILSCKKKDNGNDNEEGANDGTPYLEAKVNGTMVRLDKNPEVLFTPYGFSLSVDDGNHYFHLLCQNPNSGTYTTSSSTIIYMSYISQSPYMNVSCNNEPGNTYGTGSISFQKNGNTVTGTFSFSAEGEDVNGNPTGQTIQITDGKFLVKDGS